MQYTIEKRNWVIISILFCVFSIVFSIVNSSPVIAIGSILFWVIISFICNEISTLYIFIIIIYFISDQLSISVGGSTFKIYFFLSIIIIILQFYNLNNCVSSRILRSLLVWLLLGMFLNIFNGGGLIASRTFLGVVLQSLSAFAIFMLLDTGRLNLEFLEKAIFLIIKIGLLFGFVQYVIYLATGQAIGLNPGVALGQLKIGQIPSFRFEGNSYGKLVCWGILFFLPNITRERSNRKEYVKWLWISLLMLIISMTRAAVYALIVAVVFFLIISVLNKRLNRVIGFFIPVIILLVFYVMMLNSGVITIGSYSLYKIQNFSVGHSDISSDGSANYRYTSMMRAIEVWHTNIKNTLIGVGYAQAEGDLTSIGGVSNAQLGGCDIVTLLSSFGIIGTIMYIKLYLGTIFSAFRSLNNRSDFLEDIWVERIIYMLVYAFVLECLSGYMLCPEFWMTFGIAAFVLGNYNSTEDSYMEEQ